MNVLDDGSPAVDLSDGLENVSVLIERGPAVPTFPEFQYSPDNIEGPGCTVDPSEVTLPGCSCLSHSCCTESCSCLQTHGQAYDSSGTLLDRSRTDSGYCSPVFECNALCTCSDTCSNRVVQRGLKLRLEVYSTRNRGWGVRTLEAIPHGTFVCEYAGEVISFEEAKRRQLTQRSEENNYIIAVREHAVPRLALFAGRDIDAQEELTFDYSGGYSNQPPVELLSTQSDAATQASRTDGLQRKACHCGANKCARFLPLDLSILS